jgi:hypothetical protein
MRKNKDYDVLSILKVNNKNLRKSLVRVESGALGGIQTHIHDLEGRCPIRLNDGGKKWCPGQESNLRLPLRRRMLYSLELPGRWIVTLTLFFTFGRLRI